MHVSVELEDDPFATAAIDAIPGLRATAQRAAAGGTALIGGATAETHDSQSAQRSDAALIVPLTLVLILLIVAALVRALIAPLYLVATVVLSYAFALGVSTLVFGDSDPALPLFAFIFLVALGIDYTIFLMARVREEARRHGTREGMLRALAATGGVITSAGIILAGTFSVLMTLPVSFTFDLGLMVALGILLDTFIVRTIMVPAAVEVIGDKIWWPSTARAGGRLREETGEHPVPEPAEAG
jgi:RND superfamily putative drug exporter